MHLSKHPAAIKSRNRRAAYRRRLIEKLGGRCEKCGRTENLEPHHKTPRTWASREKWAMTRLLIYLKEADSGAVGLLCRGCNAAAGAPVGEDLEF
jgi:hypothetical protein